MKTSELTGAALDWAVAKCEDFNDGRSIIRVWNNRVTKIIPGDYETSEVYTSYTPSTDWAQAGPIIEREGISTTQFQQDEVDDCDVGMWCAAYNRDDFGNDTLSCTAPTLLIAAMRCYVASKLGDDVDVPTELTEGESK